MLCQKVRAQAPRGFRTRRGPPLEPVSDGRSPRPTRRPRELVPQESNRPLLPGGPAWPPVGSAPKLLPIALTLVCTRPRRPPCRYLGRYLTWATARDQILSLRGPVVLASPGTYVRGVACHSTYLKNGSSGWLLSSYSWGSRPARTGSRGPALRKHRRRWWSWRRRASRTCCRSWPGPGVKLRESPFASASPRPPSWRRRSLGVRRPTSSYRPTKYGCSGSRSGAA